MSEGQLIAGQPDVSDTPAKTFSRPPLFLHIGRGKSGSSTIQGLAHEYADFMNAMGVACPLTVSGNPNHSRLALALQSGTSLETIEKFRKDIRRIKRKKVFISAEALFSLTRIGMARLKRHVGDRELRLLCYIRDYPSWLQSLYAQHTKRAANVDDFDIYYRAIRPNVSAMPLVERWADEFGWKAIHVRPLQPETLVGGDLLTDVLYALGVNSLPPDLEVRNVAPHWMTLELQRALAALAMSKSIVLDARTLRVTRLLFEKFADGVEPRKVQYLTRAQWLELADLYRADMATLSQHLGLPFPINLVAPPERSFLPDLSGVSELVKSNVLRSLNTARYRSRLPSAVIELVQEALSPNRL